MEWVSKNEIFFQSERKVDSEYFYIFGVGLRVFSPGRAKGRGKFDCEVFFLKRRGKPNWT